MAKRTHPTIVGAFILGASALLVAAIVVWGSGRLFEHELKFVCYFPGSVHGLEVGAPVKYRGVPIGRVTGMRVSWEQPTGDYHIPVFIELKAHSVKELGAQDHDPRRLIGTLVDAGLRARLDSESLVTGQLYVNLEYFPSSPATRVHAGVNTDIPEIPTVPQQLEELTKSISAFVEQLKKVDLAGIAKSLQNTVDGIDRIVSMPSVRRTLDELPGTIAATKKLIVDLDVGVGGVGPELRAVLDPRGNTLSELTRTLTDVQHAAQAVRAFADFLQRNPNALLVGKKRP